MPPIYKAPPPAYFTWTGWYLGLNGGGGWGQTSHTATFGAVGAPALTTGNFNTRAGWHYRLQLSTGTMARRR